VDSIPELALAAYAAFYGDRAVPLAGGAVAFRVAEACDSPLLNRVAGLGLAAPATEEDVDAALAALAGTTHYVSVAPDARPPELARWLQARGLVPGWGWMQFRRGVEDVPRASSGLELVEVDRRTAPAFARVVRGAYGLPPEVEPFLERIVETPWKAWLALAGDEPAAAAASFADGAGAYLGFAATVPEHRSRGAQTALLAERIRAARELGCRWVATETGEQQPGRPSASYRNILRAGFVEQFVVANWRGGVGAAA
jgi:GNAT superfamily N-acetyltransferase